MICASKKLKFRLSITRRLLTSRNSNLHHHFQKIQIPENNNFTVIGTHQQPNNIMWIDQESKHRKNWFLVAKNSDLIETSESKMEENRRHDSNEDKAYDDATYGSER